MKKQLGSQNIAKKETVNSESILKNPLGKLTAMQKSCLFWEFQKEVTIIFPFKLSQVVVKAPFPLRYNFDKNEGKKKVHIIKKNTQLNILLGHLHVKIRSQLPFKFKIPI